MHTSKREALRYAEECETLAQENNERADTLIEEQGEASEWTDYLRIRAEHQDRLAQNAREVAERFASKD